MKIKFDGKIKCWRADSHIIPKWTPDEVAFRRDFVITNNDKMNLINAIKIIKEKREQKGQKGQNMLDQDQNAIVVKQLQEKLTNLKSEKANYVRRIADLGNCLHNIIIEIDDIEDVLNSIKLDEKCDDCECDQ